MPCPHRADRGVSGKAGLGTGPAVFVFFSNSLGCVGSLLVSAVVTVILLVLLGVLG